MHISILTFDGFNELDSLIALGILNQVKNPHWRISIASPTPQVASMNGVLLKRHISLAESCRSDAIIIGSGIQTRNIIADKSIMAQLQFDPSQQLIAAQCSGTLILAKLGLLNGLPACTDLTTRPWAQELGIEVLNQPFFAESNIASAGGCLASHYLAAWVIARLKGIEAAQAAIHYVAPVGEKEEYIQRAMEHITPFIDSNRM